MGESSRNILKKRRVEALFKECESTVINSTLSAFGLNQGMFSDRDGGNVTTLHNFERDDLQFVNERDHDSFIQANNQYDRKDYKLSNSQWEKKKQKHKASGIDGYTGKEFKDPDSVDLDHIQPLAHVHENKKNHLAYNTGTQAGKNNLKEVVNSDENLVSTDSSINRSKGKKTNQEFVDKLSNERKQELGINEEDMRRQQQEAESYINSKAQTALLKKQSSELLKTGANQARAMAFKQAIGVLLTKVINILFNEIKYLLKEKRQLSKETFSDLKNRVFKNIRKLIQEVPNILSSAFQGGTSGFVSNLITFIINNFLSSIKKFVTMIREGLLGIYKSLKILFFPPQGMSHEDKWRTAIKIFSTTVISSIIISFSEVIKGFLITFPILLPISDIMSVALVGIFSGLLSALAAYFIDSIFDKVASKNRFNEQVADMLMENATHRDKLANHLIHNMNVSISNIQIFDALICKNKKIIESFQSIGEKTTKIMITNNTMLNDLDSTVNRMNLQKKSIIEATSKSIETNVMMDDFLTKYKL